MRDNLVPILFVTHAAKKGGAEQSLIHLMNYIDTSRFRIFFISPPDTAYLKEIRTEFVHVPLALGSIKKRLGFGYIETVMRIRAVVKRHDIAIIHANGWRAPWYIAPLKALTNCKLVWHHRDHTHLKMFNKVLPRFFDQVICISHFVASAIESDKKTIIYNGVDPELTLPTKSRELMEDGRIIIGTFGRIVEWKRYDLVVEAMKKLTDSGCTNWRLLIVGDASVDGSQQYYHDLMHKVLDYGLEHQVDFYGYSPAPLEVMKECDLTINFSLNEPFGRVIIESMLAGTPVIVSDSGGAPEIIHHTDGGLIVPDGNVDALSEAIRSIYDGRVNHEELASSGYRNVMREFHMKTIARKVEQSYETLLHPGSLQAEAVR